MTDKEPTIIEDRVQDPHAYARELEEEVRGLKNLKRVAGHELTNKVTVLLATAKMLYKAIERLDSRQIGEEQKGEMLEITELLRSNAGQVKSIGSLLNLGQWNRKELKSNSKPLDMEYTVKDSLQSLDMVFRKEGVHAEFLYNRIEGSPIQLFSHEGLMYSIASTISSNQIKHAPRNSTIKQGIRIVNDNLGHDFEYRAENMITVERDIQREHYGMQTGLGFILLQNAAHMLKGRLSIYDQPLDEREYQFKEDFGDHEAKNFRGDIFGLSLRIPVSELMAYISPKKS